MKKDCYFHGEERDMGATIQLCNYYTSFEAAVYAKCEGCPRYIKRSEVDRVVRDFVERKRHDLS